eukprot:SM000017S02814  [mRNA]  locus=s17:459314:462095:- [translate_table: standard]
MGAVRAAGPAAAAAMDPPSKGKAGGAAAKPARAVAFARWALLAIALLTAVVTWPMLLPKLRSHNREHLDILRAHAAVDELQRACDAGAQLADAALKQKAERIEWLENELRACKEAVKNCSVVEELRAQLATKDEEVEKLKFAYQVLWQSQMALANSSNCKEPEEPRDLKAFKDEKHLHVEKVMEAAKEAVKECDKLRHRHEKLGNVSAIGYECSATAGNLKQYLTYERHKECPNDWLFVQSLIFEKNCFVLPRRRCFAPMPEQYTNPLPFPESLWAQEALVDTNVRWDNHHHSSFAEINNRTMGDCPNCFNLTLEFLRWRSKANGAIPMKDVVRMKRGTLRIGLDVGGRTGSFAARMARWNITIVTSSRNRETGARNAKGLPYMEAVALRGLVPLHMPMNARLPFFDGTLDIVHTSSSLKGVNVHEFEELLFEWDRILRPAGIIWIEMFYLPTNLMPVYVHVIDLLGYKNLYWEVTAKDMSMVKNGVPHLYLNCVIEKPRERALATVPEQ